MHNTPEINLSLYLSSSERERIRATLRNGKVVESWVRPSGLTSYPYKIGEVSYDSQGRYWHKESPLDIVDVHPFGSLSMSREDCLEAIRILETRLKNYKEYLELSRPSTVGFAEVGEVLGDGSILLKKENGIALLAAPDSTEIEASWDNRLKVYTSITEHGFRGEEWFLPSASQLDLAHVAAPEHLTPNKCYWSSESIDEGLARMCTGGPQDKRATLRVRLFRCVTY